MAKSLFQPDIGSMTLYAFQLLGLRPTSLLQEHIESARMATNMLLSRWSAEGVNLWEVSPFDIPLIEGKGTYLAPDDIVGLLDVFIRQPNAGSQSQDMGGLDRIMMSVGRSEYASYPDKQLRGFPAVFWFNQQIDSTINIWPAPNDGSLRLMGYYLRQIPLVGMQNGGSVAPSAYPEIPLYFQEAFIYGLASRLAIIWLPEKAQMLDMLSKEAYQAASEQNVEDTPIYFSPQTRGYFI
jgi:hypothetical protein